VLDVKIESWPTHAASKPVAMIPELRATRHAHIVLDGSGPAYLETPKLSDWPDVNWKPSKEAKRVDLDSLTPAEVASWQPGDRLLLNGRMLTGRDAAHKRIQDMIARGSRCRSSSPAASSIMSARSIRCATKWSARPAPPRPPAWTSSPR
jgi:fumarate hydratase class I